MLEPSWTLETLNRSMDLLGRSVKSISRSWSPRKFTGRSTPTPSTAAAANTLMLHHPSSVRALQWARERTQLGGKGSKGGGRRNRGGAAGAGGADQPEYEDADEDDAIEPRGGVDVLLGTAPRRSEPRLERRVGPARGVHLDVRWPATEQRVGRGEEHGEGQVDPHRRRERRQDHRAGGQKKLPENSTGEAGPAGQWWKKQSCRGARWVRKTRTRSRLRWKIVVVGTVGPRCQLSTWQAGCDCEPVTWWSVVGTGLSRSETCAIVGPVLRDVCNVCIYMGGTPTCKYMFCAINQYVSLNINHAMTIFYG